MPTVQWEPLGHVERKAWVYPVPRLRKLVQYADGRKGQNQGKGKNMGDAENLDRRDFLKVAGAGI